MNKMNLPPPFDQDNSIEIVNLTMTRYQSTKRRNDSEEEIEESDEEVYEQENKVNYVPNLVPRRRKVKRLKVGFVGDKIIERNIKKGSEKKEISREKIFEKANLIVDKPNILIHIKHDDNQTKETQRKEAQGKGSQANDAQEKEIQESASQENVLQESASQGFGVIQPQDKFEAEEPVKELFDFKNLITESELRLNRLSRSQWNEPGYSKLFKNYEHGHPNCRLYIKNIAKQAQSDDLKRIFGRWINLDSETERNM